MSKRKMDAEQLVWRILRFDEDLLDPTYPKELVDAEIRDAGGEVRVLQSEPTFTCVRTASSAVSTSPPEPPAFAMSATAELGFALISMALPSTTMRSIKNRR
jgi:hypothetical protein